MDEVTRTKATEEWLRQIEEERLAVLRAAQVPAPRRHRGSTVGELVDRDKFSVDGGKTWYVCAVVLFGTVSVYCGRRRDQDADTIRLDADREAACLVAVRR